MATDSRLQNLQKDLENLNKAQVAITEDIRSLRKTMEDKVKRIQNDYGNDISTLERKYDGNTRRIPDVNRQIEARQNEIERDLQNNATRNSSGANKLGW